MPLVRQDDVEVILRDDELLLPEVFHNLFELLVIFLLHGSKRMRAGRLERQHPALEVAEDSDASLRPCESYAEQSFFVDPSDGQRTTYIFILLADHCCGVDDDLILATLNLNGRTDLG